MIHNQLTNYTNLLAGYRRILGEMGVDFTGIERAGETLTPIVDPWALPDWALLRGEVIYARGENSGAVAARYSSYELVNAAGSGVLAVVDFIRCGVGAGTFDLSVDAGGSIAANPTTYRGVACDARYSPGEVSRCSLVTGDVAAGVSLRQEILQSGQTSPLVFIIPPGSKLFVIGTALNTAISAIFRWTERPILQTESRLG